MYPDLKIVLIKFKGEFVDIMIEDNPIYAREVRILNGRKVLYVQLLRALYGCMERVENVSTENSDKVSKREVIINNTRTYADVVSYKKNKG